MLPPLAEPPRCGLAQSLHQALRMQAKEGILIARDTDQLAQTILAYVRANPAASDSVRGIRDWWLCETRSPPDDVQLLEALEALASAGLLRRIENPDGTALWMAGPSLGG